MKNIFLLALLISFNIVSGQSTNELVMNYENYPDFFPSDSLIIKNKIKSFTRYTHLPYNMNEKSSYYYDTKGKLTRIEENDSNDTTKVVKSRSYFYKDNIKYIIKTGGDWVTSKEKSGSVMIYYNQFRQDTLSIDSLVDSKGLTLHEITRNLYDDKTNLLKQKIWITNIARDKPLEKNFTCISDYQYDNFKRIIKEIRTVSMGDAPALYQSLWTYEKPRQVYFTTNHYIGTVNSTLYFDKKNRLYKVSDPANSVINSYSLKYNGENIIQKQEYKDIKYKYTYQKGLPLQMIKTEKKEMKRKIEYCYEFYK